MSDIEDDYTLEEEDTIHVSDLEIGDILEFERKLGPFTYYHCGNYAGNNMIIHKGTAPGVGGVQAIQAKWNNDIGYRIDSIDQVARGSKVYRNNMLDDTISPSKEELILRAKAMYGEADYDPFYNNCQHFCTKLRYDIGFSRQAEFLTKGTFLTSAGHDFTTKMAHVSFNDGDFNLASSDIINKYEYKDRLNLSDNRKPAQNKDLIVMTFRQANYTSSFEKQAQNAVPLFNTGLNVVFLNTSVGAQMLRTIPSSFKCESHNILLILNTGPKLVLFDTFNEVHISRTNANSFECQQYSALSLLNTGFFNELFDTSVEAKMARSITRYFERQPHNAQHLYDIDFNPNISTKAQMPQTITSFCFENKQQIAHLFRSLETQMSRTITSSFDNQPLNAQQIFNTDLCVDSCDTSLETQMPRTITSSFDNQPLNAQQIFNIDLCVDSCDTSLETQMPRTITSTFDNQPQNAQHLFNTDLCVDSCDTSLETQMPRTITSSFDHQPLNAPYIFNTDLCVDSCDTSLETQMPRTITSSFDHQPQNAQHVFSTDLYVDSCDTSLETQMPRTITSSFDNQQQNAQHVFNTDLYVDSFDTSLETQMLRTITSSFDNQPQYAPYKFNTDLCVDSCDTSLETQMPRTITSSFDHQPQNAQHLFNTDCNPYSSTKFLKCCYSEKKSRFKQLVNTDICDGSFYPTSAKVFGLSDRVLYTEYDCDCDTLVRVRAAFCNFDKADSANASSSSLQHNAFTFFNTGYNVCSPSLSNHNYPRL